MDETSLFIKFGIAIILGILVGLQREFEVSDPNREIAAGIRTFGLIGLTGCLSAFLSKQMNSPMPLIFLILIVGIFLSVNYYFKAKEGKMGLTTNMSALIVFLSGAIVYLNYVTLAIALIVTTTIILTFKIELHTFVHKLSRIDIYSSLKFAVISAIILPVLPNKTFGFPPFDIINPFKIWLLVVFISGISYIGYILIKIAGPNKGIGLTGFLGGIASSTALTLSFTGRSINNESFSKTFAFAILVSWTVMFVKVLGVVVVINYQLLHILLLPVTILIAVGLISGFFIYMRKNIFKNNEELLLTNPFELATAIKFGFLFTIILLLSKLAQFYFGNKGIYISSFFTALPDVDPIALSISELSKNPLNVDALTASRAILIASVANTLSKGCMVMFLGAKSLRNAILPGFICIILTGILFVIVI